MDTISQRILFYKQNNLIDKGRKSPARCDMLDIRLSYIHIGFMQRTRLATTVDVTSVSSPWNMKVDVDLVLQDVAIGGASSRAEGKDAHVSVLFNNLSLKVDSNIVAPSLSKKEADLDISISAFLLAMTRDNIDFSTSVIVAKLGHRTPECLVAMTEPLIRQGKEFAPILKSWKSHTSDVFWGNTAFAVKAGGEQEIIDPLSTTQPLYLVQSGMPRELRTDIPYRFLFHLRNALWHRREKRDLSPFSVAENLMSPDDLVPLLKRLLASVDPEANPEALGPLYPSIGQQLFNTTIPEHLPLRPKPPAPPLEPKYQFALFSGKIDLASIVVFDPDGGASSEFSSSNLVLDARINVLFFDGHGPHALEPKVAPGPVQQEKTKEVCRRLMVSFLVGDATLTVLPHLLNFTQEILRVNRLYRSRIISRRNATDPSKTLPSPVDPSQDMTLVQFIFSIGRFRTQAIAQNIIFEVGTSAFRLTTYFWMRHFYTLDISDNTSVFFRRFFVQARSPYESSKELDQDILASLMLTSGAVNLVARHNNRTNFKFRTMARIDHFHFTVPRSALKLYHFLQEWRADFLPGLEATARALLNEFRKSTTQVHSSPKPPPSATSSAEKKGFEVHIRIQSLGVFLRVMRETWATWEIRDPFIHFDSSAATSQLSAKVFGVKMASQVFAVLSKAHDSDAKDRMKLELPQVIVSGVISGENIRAMVQADLLELKVKPSHWDTLLTVQQKFGQDFQDLLALVQQTRDKSSRAPDLVHAAPTKSRLKVDISAKMKGFRIGLDGRTSTLYLECLDINSSFTNTLEAKWSITLTDLALSLATARSIAEPFNRGRRSAFVIIDLKVTGSKDEKYFDVLRIAFTKIHAVMQPSSIGEVGDFVDYLQVRSFASASSSYPQ
jgi:prepilin-type processing-associated H-X9-DG protein